MLRVTARCVSSCSSARQATVLQMANAQEFLEKDEKKNDLFLKFKANVQDCHDKLFDKRDEYLLRWLKARNFNITEAEKMLRKSLAWRQKEGADDIVETWAPPEVIVKYFSFGKIGNDKFGCPVFASRQGRTDFRGILHSVTKKDYMKFQVHTTERTNRDMLEESIRTGTNPWCRVTTISDMEGLSIRQLAYKPAMDCGSEQFDIYEANYPENLRRIFIINAPTIFTIVYNWMKPFLHQATIEKFRIFGSDREEWQKALLEEIDADQLPQCYGGTMTDPDGDPDCSSLFNKGGEVPRSYYLSNNRPVVKDHMESMTIIAGAGGFKKLKFKIEEANSILRWEFMSEGGDIGFRVYYKDPKEGEVDFIPPHRVDSHLVMEEGEIPCENLGEYVVHFDNTFSYFKTKKVHYSIVIKPPTIDEQANIDPA